MIAHFPQSNYDETDWPKLWQLEGLVNSVLSTSPYCLAALPLPVLAAALFVRVRRVANEDGGLPLDEAWTRNVLLREAISLKRTLANAK